MRFKKGDKVEVLYKGEDHAESWWCAEIISGYGNKYYVRYDRDLLGVGSSVERAPRRAIRPCPPSAMGRLDWVPGDIVEVLNNFSWKLAKIVMFSGQECFFVRILGSPMELVVHSSFIRLRQCWQDNKWVVLQKESAKCGDRPTHGFSKEMFVSGGAQLVGDQFQAGKTISFGNTSQTFRTGAKKMPRNRLRTSENFLRALGKTRTAEKKNLQGAFASRSTRWNKVDAVASPQTMFGEKYMHSSLINRETRIFDTSQRVGISIDHIEDCSRIVLERSDAESVSSSVGSCSVIKSPYRSISSPLYDMYQDMESNHDLLEASEASVRANEAVAEDIHNLEIHAYRCTMAALYASGPISWEQEALLTNLRLMLHISNDEHSMELKNLASQTNVLVR